MENQKSNPEDLYTELNSVKTNLEEVIGKVPENINPHSVKINQYISKYTADLIGLINKISENIKEFKNLLNSQENVYTKLANYYLNHTSTSYLDIIEKAKNIFDNYYKYQNESISNEMQLLHDKLNKGFDKLKELNGYQKNFKIEKQEDITNVNNMLQNLKNINLELTKKINEEIDSQINRKLNGYFISDNDIAINDEKFQDSLNGIENAMSNSNIDTMIDKTFDEIMFNFKDNFTKVLKYLEDEKNTQFPLNEKILKDNFFSPEEEQTIKNDLDSLSGDIINQIKDKNNIYYNNINQKIDDLLNSNINSFIFEINILCSNTFLEEVSQSFQNTYKSYLNNIKNNLIKYIEHYTNYLNKDILKTQMEINDINDNSAVMVSQKFVKSIDDIKKYIKNDLITELKNAFINILDKTRNIINIIKNYQLNEKYKEIQKLSFINENKNEIDKIYQNINLYFSEEIFKNKYLEEINDIIEELNNDVNEKYSIIGSSPTTAYCSELEIYVKLNSGEYKCINIFDKPNEDINLIFPKINNDNNFKIFNNKLDIFYLSLNQLINSYKNNIETFFTSLSEIEAQLNSQKDILDFGPFSNKINSLLTDKFEEELINKIYDYYKANTNGKIENILNEFLSRINDTFNDLAEEMVENNSKFKTSLTEFGMMAIIYENLITQNITRNYFDLIIDNQKNNFNYTLSYYYNRLLNWVNSTRNNIINSLPINKYGLNTNIEEYKNKIDNKFNEFIEKIINSKNKYLNIDRQVYTLNVPRTNFYKANSILSTNVLLSRNLLQEKRSLIQSLDNDKYNTEFILNAKYYLENSNNAKQIEDFYNIIYNNNYEVLDQEKFKEIINENFEFDKNEFINQLNILLYNLNLENEKEFFDLKNEYFELFEDDFYKYFINENEEGILDKINNLYNNEFKFSKNNINEIYENINTILDKIISHLNEESNKINNEAISYNNDYSKIKQKIDEYKNEIINEIE